MKKLAVIILLFYTQKNMAQSISATGGTWTPAVVSITEAGNNYASGTLQSAANQTLISVTMPSVLLGTLPNHYTVQIRRTDSGPGWNAAGLQLWARRTGDGTGGGSFLLLTSTITGGLAYQQITTGNAYFFEGNNYGTTPRINIPVQYQISGISVLVPVNNYITTITYTLVDD